MNLPQPTRVLLPLVFGLAIAVASPAQGPEKGEKGKAPAETKAPATRKVEPASHGKAVSLPIGVVDLDAVLEHTSAWKKGQDLLAQMKAHFEGKMKAADDKIESLQYALKLLNDSPERDEKELELGALAQRRQLAAKLYNRELARARNRNEVQMVEEVDVVISVLAAKRGLLLVLRKRNPLKLPEKTPKADAARINSRRATQRNILYHAPSLEITQDVIKYLKGN